MVKTEPRPSQDLIGGVFARQQVAHAGRTLEKVGKRTNTFYGGADLGPDVQKKKCVPRIANTLGTKALDNFRPDIFCGIFDRDYKRYF